MSYDLFFYATAIAKRFLKSSGFIFTAAASFWSISPYRSSFSSRIM